MPIRVPESAADKKHAERITQSVKTIMDAKTAIREGGGGTKLSDGERRRLESTVESNEQRIDEAVFALYGVDGLPD